MCHLVGESLHVVHLPVGVVVHYDVVGGRDGALPHVLTHQKEVIPETHTTLSSRDPHSTSIFKLEVCLFGFIVKLCYTVKPSFSKA